MTGDSEEIVNVKIAQNGMLPPALSHSILLTKYSLQGRSVTPRYIILF